jgi:hypothetical protein
MTWPVGGDYVNTTYFLTDDRALDHLQLLVQQPAADEVALFTDGLQMLLLQFDTRKAHGPFFEQMFAQLRKEPVGESERLTRALQEFLESPGVNSRTDDDKTLVLATRLVTVPPGAEAAVASTTSD